MNNLATKQAPPLHHSVSDWDFLIVSDWSAFSNWELNTDSFISPPSAIRFEPRRAEIEAYALSNLPLAQDIKAGRLITWVRRDHDGLSFAKIYFGVTGPNSTGISYRLTNSNFNWMKRRFDWWQGYDLHNDPATIVDFYLWDDPDWMLYSRDYYPPLTGSINRLGVGSKSNNSDGWRYFDDTELWLPI